MVIPQPVDIEQQIQEMAHYVRTHATLAEREALHQFLTAQVVRVVLHAHATQQKAQQYDVQPPPSAFAGQVASLTAQIHARQQQECAQEAWPAREES